MLNRALNTKRKIDIACGIFRWIMKEIILAAPQVCQACEMCVKVCKRDVFDIEDVDGEIVSVIKHPENCNSCGDCIRYCDSSQVLLKQLRLVVPDFKL